MSALQGGFFPECEPPAAQPPQPTIESSSTLAARRAHQVEDHGFDEEGDDALEEAMREDEGLPPTSTAKLGACADCGDSDGQPKFFEAFGLSICYDCQRAGRGPGGRYQMISKSKAKEEYLLTDRQLSRAQGGLGCLTQKNPHDSRYGDMKLFLRAQVEQLALQTWGTAEALFDEKERRTQERLAKADARKRKAAGLDAGVPNPASRRSSGVAKAGTSSSKGNPSTGAVQQAYVTHTHTFLDDETYDEATDMWTKRCACGFEVQYEKI